MNLAFDCEHQKGQLLPLFLRMKHKGKKERLKCDKLKCSNVENSMFVYSMAKVINTILYLHVQFFIPSIFRSLEVGYQKLIVG